MIVSWNWLNQYVDLRMSSDELIHRLTMSGLNFDGLQQLDDDWAIDLEVTSNRPDCLGHLGVAREIAVLFDTTLTIPEPSLSTSRDSIDKWCSVELHCPDLCHRYTARLIRGVKVGPSPPWMQSHLQSIGITAINNIVDATNYVLFECGQPLHAFDFSRIADRTILVREPTSEETMTAIDHKIYKLFPGMCVIADSRRPLAIGGVMGGADSEISASTTDVLLEAAYFSPLAVRNAARTLNLHSPSSFRFERNVDSAGIEWASRRCCQLILQSAGGELVSGVLDVGQPLAIPTPIVLRYSQLKKVLGIDIPVEFVAKTLSGLGLSVDLSTTSMVSAVPPSWRKDLTREVDLVEEIGRIYGYEHVPDDARVPMAASYKTKPDRVLDKVRHVLTACGFHEAMTASLVPEGWSTAFSPWSTEPPLISSQPMQGVLEKASQNIGAVEYLRRSLIPSLLEARRINEYRANPVIELFETAKVYLSRGEHDIPDQPTLVGLTSGRGYFELKGVIETLLEHLSPGTQLEWLEFQHPLLDVNRSGRLQIEGQNLGVLGQVSAAGLTQFGLRNATCIAELDLGVMQHVAVLVPIHRQQSYFPAIVRDFNLVMNEEVRWSAVESTVRQTGGELLEFVRYLETFRDERKDGPGKKRILLSVTLRSQSETLTSDQAEALSQTIIDQCHQQHGAVLLS